MKQIVSAESGPSWYGPLNLNLNLNPDLEFLLGQVAEAMQLTQPQRSLAEARYAGVATWLGQSDSALAPLHPRLYPQGSMALGTTVRPRKSVEYDLDVVCELDDPGKPAPVVYEEVFSRLQANPAYRGILTKKNRCLCLDYANDFHLDLIPAVPDALRRGTAIKVPDRKLQDWTPSNPKGFARWFDGQSRGLQFRADSVEPLPRPLPAALKPALTVAVQLIKRRRDMIFDGDDDAPRSIILTTLAATYYSGTTSVTSAVGEIAASVEQAIRQRAPAWIEIRNPSNDGENFSDGMTQVRYTALTGFVRQLQADVHELARTEGLPEFQRALLRMFGEPVRGVIETYAERLRRARETGTLGFSGKALKGAGHLAIVASSPLATPVPRHRYYGG